MKPKIATATLFLCTSGCLALVFFKTPPALWNDSAYTYHPLQIALLVSSGILLFATVRVFFNPRFAYIMALLGCVIGLPWFLWSEAQHFQILNSWITFNLPDKLRFEDYDVIRLSQLRILAVALLLITLFCTTLRLLPKRWMLRNLPVRSRTWPAVAAATLAIAVWYLLAVSPYRIPIIVDSFYPNLRILHVVKRGLHFTEATMSVFIDGKLYITRAERRLFQYRWSARQFSSRLSKDDLNQALALDERMKSEHLKTLPPRRLTAWNAEGWFVVGKSGVLAYTTEYGTEPPRELVDFFQRLEGAATAEQPVSEVRDICLGFCYDPWAGLGSAFINQRCRDDKNGTHCE